MTLHGGRFTPEPAIKLETATSILGLAADDTGRMDAESFAALPPAPNDHRDDARASPSTRAVPLR